MTFDSKKWARANRKKLRWYKLVPICGFRGFFMKCGLRMFDGLKILSSAKKLIFKLEFKVRYGHRGINSKANLMLGSTKKKIFNLLGTRERPAGRSRCAR